MRDRLEGVLCAAVLLYLAAGYAGRYLIRRAFARLWNFTRGQHA